MILGIDAFNISRGGGITHLVEILRVADPYRYEFEKVILWGGISTLAKVETRPWLVKIHEPLLDRGLPFRVFWHRFLGRRRAEAAGCDVVFLPGGTASSRFSPAVTMSRNMLPFEWREMFRYGLSWVTFKLLILRWTQGLSFKKADGLIFLTEYARKSVTAVVKLDNRPIVTIPHGINPRFFHAPRLPPKTGFSKEDSCRLLYVSIVSPYKHQWNVVEAVAKLRSEGFPLTLELIGPPDVGTGRLQQAIRAADPANDYIFYRGPIPYESLEKQYVAADIGIFASSCENMPNILLEGMAAGLPMACSSMGPMPEILGDGGEYFNPLNPNDIARALRKLIASPELRACHAQAAFDRAKNYSWQRCATDTLAFLAKVAKNRTIKVS